MRISKKVMVLLVLLVTAMTVSVMPCLGSCEATPGEIATTGVLKKQGMTTYMYGTHVIHDDTVNKSYALRSSGIDLDKYVNQNVTVKGALVPGYPVESGPDFLEVISINSN